MSGWENLLGPSTGTQQATRRGGEPAAADRSVQEKFDAAFTENADTWKGLREYEAYSAGRMYGACSGPDQVGIGDVLTKFVSMVSNLLQDSHWRVDKPIDKDVLKMLELASKVVSNMDSDDAKVPPIRMVAYLNGFCDGYVSTCDPESVKSLTYK